MVKKLIFTIMLLAMLVFCFAGCEDPNPYNSGKVKYTEYFHYMSLDNESIVVMGLTELGKEQEILTIPAFIDGKPVKEVGYVSHRLVPYTNTPYHIESNVLKKMYFPWTVEEIRGRCLVFNNVEEYVFTSIELVRDREGMEGLRSVFLAELYDSMNLSYAIRGLANLIYYFNYDNSPNSGYYWADLITGSNLFANPETPQRDGFEFAGWYLDENCGTEWNKIMPANEVEKLNLYANWIEAN